MKLRIKKIEGAKQINASKISKSGIIKKLKKGYVLSKQKKETAEIKKVYLPEGLVLPPAYAPYPYPEYRGPAPQKEEQEAEPTEEKVEGIEIVKASKIAGKPLRLTEERESIRFINVKTPLIPREPNEGEYVFAYSHIEWDRKTNNLVYSVMEPEITEEEKEIINKVKVDLEERLDIDFTKLGEVRAKEVLREEIQKSLQFIAAVETERLMVLTYYIERDIIGLGKIESLMRDPNIEDISCDGVMIPIYIFHRDPRIASIRTNIYFYDDDELNEFVSRLAQKANKTISIAEPLLDASLPDGSRIQATLGTDIARKGSNFCVKDSFVQLVDGSIEKMDSLFEKLKATQGSCFDEYGNEIVDYPLISTVGVNEANLRQENSKVIRILKLPPPERLVKVYFKELGKNRSLIEVTENHKFHILTPYSIKTTPSINLKPDMWIPVPAKIDVNIKKLPIEEYLEKLEKMFTELDLYIVLNKELRAHLNIGKIKTSHSILNDIKRGKTNSIKFSLLKNAGLSLNNIKSKHIDCIKRRERKGRGKKISLPLIPSEDLAHFVGWCLGDGSITKNGISIHTGINKNHKKIVSSLIKRLFNIDSVSYKIDTERLYINSGIISNFLNYCFDAPTGKKSRNIDSPKIIEKSPNAIISGFIKGLFESDGSFTKNIQFVTSSERMAKKIIFLMTRLGIYSTYNKSEDVYRIYVPSSYYKKFSRLVLNNKETQKLVLKQEKTKVSHMLPFFCIEPLISEAKESGIKTKDLYRICNITDARKNGKITFDKAKALSNYINGKNKQYIDYLTSGKFEFKQIVDVEIIEKNKSPVYDITCNPVNFYIGGKDTPLFMHDTIRKFTERPLTPTHMLRFGSLDAMQLAYMWLAIDNGQSVLISGGSATGKTSLLNALSLFIRPSLKVVSIEDTPELRLPLPHWIPHVARSPLSIEGQIGEVSLFDLLKASVDYDEPLIVRNSGEIKVETIGKRVDKYYEEDESDIEKRADHFEVLAFDPETLKIRWKKVSHVYRHKIHDPLFMLTLENNRSVKLTNSHSVFVIDKNGITTKSTINIKKGDFVIIPKRIPRNNKNITLNIAKELSKLSEKDIGNIFIKNIPMNIIKNNWKKIRIYAKNNLRAANDACYRWKKARMLPLKLQSIIPANIIKDCKLIWLRGEIPTIIPINKYFMRLLGYYTAEGSFNKNREIRFSFNENDSDLIKDIKKCVKSLLGIEIHLSTQRNCTNVMIQNKGVGLLLDKVIKVSRGAKNKRIPTVVFNVSEELQKEYLLAYIKGDFGITVSRNLSCDLQYLYNMLALVAGTSIKKSASKINGRKINSSKAYSLNLQDKKISGTKRYSMLPKMFIYNLIGQYLDRTRLKQWYRMSQEHFNKYYGKGINLLRAFQKGKDKISSASEQRVLNWLVIQNLAKYQNNRIIITENGKKFLDAVNIIEKHFNSDLAYARVKSIEKVKSAGKYVYDISVPGAENFVSGFGGVVCHNSLRQRPDYIIVGEVRGREAFVLFQQMATGHPSLATIHAASLPQLVDRLITPPISLPPSLLENINIIVFLSLTRLHGNYVRKADSILEVVGIKRDRPETKKVFQWKPITNTFEITDKSVVLKSVARRLGLTEDTVQEELLRRKRVLEWMLERGLYDYIDVANVISIYYADPERVMDLIAEG